MKKCDLCGETGYGTTEIFEQYRTNDVKVVCSRCAEILDGFVTDLHNYAEKLMPKAKRKIMSRLLKIERDKVGNTIFFYLNSLRGIFKKKIVQHITEAKV